MGGDAGVDADRVGKDRGGVARFSRAPLTEDEFLDELDNGGLRLGDDPMSLVSDAMSDHIDQVDDELQPWTAMQQAFA